MDLGQHASCMCVSVWGGVTERCEGTCLFSATLCAI